MTVMKIWSEFYGLLPGAPDRLYVHLHAHYAHAFAVAARVPGNYCACDRMDSTEDSKIPSGILAALGWLYIHLHAHAFAIAAWQGTVVPRSARVLRSRLSAGSMDLQDS